MAKATSVRNHLLELLVVFVGVALAFAVENVREGLNERAAARQYLAGFVEDLERDREMLASNLEARRAQLAAAHLALEFYEGRDLDVDVFFDAFYTVLPVQGIRPNRNTMVEVLNSGSLRLIRDAELRSAILELYASYDRLLSSEAHLDRDFDQYLYDETFSTIRFQYQGPWSQDASSARAAELVLGNLTIENGLRLVLANVETPGGIIDLLQASEVELELVLDLIRAVGPG